MTISVRNNASKRLGAISLGKNLLLVTPLIVHPGIKSARRANLRACTSRSINARSSQAAILWSAASVILIADMKLSIRNLDLKDKRLLIRVDFNVPLKDGVITDDTRIRETIPTIEYALRRKAKVILCSHLGRPKGKVVESMSLRPVVDRLRLLLDHVIDQDENVAFSPDCVGEIATELANNLESGQPLLLENLRFHIEEEGSVKNKDGTKTKADPPFDFA